MTKVKEGDFLELEYTGIMKDGTIFDTTSEEIAKKEGIFNEKIDAYKPIILKQGMRHVIQGLDEDLIGKELDKKYEIELQSENAFGKKNASLIKTFSIANFRKQNIDPQPGMQLNLDGMPATILRVGGGRVIVDFNHYLAGKDLKYEYKITRIVEDEKEKTEAIIGLSGLKGIAKLEEKEEKLVVKAPESITEHLKKLFEENGLKAEINAEKPSKAQSKSLNT